MSAAASSTVMKHEGDVLVWSVVTRVTHWVIALGIFVLAATGLYIGHPFLAAPGSATVRFVMGTVRVIHLYAAIAFTLAVGLRTLWFLVGNRYERWDQFIPWSRERRASLWGTLKFYLLLRRRPPDYAGHNAMAGAAYAVLFVLYAAMILTGLGLYSMGASVGSPLRAFQFVLSILGGAQTARWIHHAVTWVLLAFVVQHVYSSILTSIIERNGEVDSIVSGHKHMPLADEPKRAAA